MDLSLDSMRILTFDVEEWFHILDNESTKSEKDWGRYEHRLEKNMEQILVLLESKNLKATFFCLGWVAREFPHIIRSIAEKGHEIASHSDQHQLLFEQNRDEFGEDLYRSVSELEDITGSKVISYRAPGFSLIKEYGWAFEVLAMHGIEVDCSVFPAVRAHGGFSSFGSARPVWVEAGGIRLKEFPINLYPIAGRNLVFSGGGYFRLLPYPVISYMMRRSEYVMTYFHPRDFDPLQPVIQDLGLTRKFKSYYGLASAYRKLERLVSDFSFIDLKAALNIYNWETADIIRV